MCINDVKECCVSLMSNPFTCIKACGNSLLETPGMGRHTLRSVGALITAIALTAMGFSYTTHVFTAFLLVGGSMGLGLALIIAIGDGIMRAMEKHANQRMYENYGRF